MQVIEAIYLVAIAFVWSRGSIFKRLRERGPKLWVALADCPLCSGFWIGLLGHMLWLTRYRFVVEWLGIGSIVGLLALATCGIVRRL